MKAQIISIGDEILIGQIVNTNAAFIGERLTLNQIETAKISVVGDEASAIITEIDAGLKNFDVVLVTGGLGPTHDDITRKCIAEYFNSELEINSIILDDVRMFFEKRNRTITPLNEEQALVPKCAEAIRNSKGTAPGFWIEKGEKVLIVMPGVPVEMKTMMDTYVIPKLIARNTQITSYSTTKTLLTTGIPESHLYEKVSLIDRIFEDTKIAFLPNQFGTKMRLTALGANEKESRDKLIQAEQKIRSVAGKYIYGADNDTLEEVIGKLLIERGQRIAVAESCTGGLIASRITDISGSSKYFERGVVTYSNAAKVEVLHINEDLITQYGAVSMQVAQQMAEGIKSISGADFGLATTGIMGPTGATPDKPIGLVYIAICDDKSNTARQFNFGDDRRLNKDRTSQAALEIVRRRLLGISYDE